MAVLNRYVITDDNYYHWEQLIIGIASCDVYTINFKP